MKKKSNWSKRSLTPHELSEMESAFLKKFGYNLKQDEDVFFEGRYTDTELFLTAILRNNEETYYYPFEAVISVEDNENIEMEEAKMLLLDFIGSYFEDYFANDRDTYIPIDWTCFEMQENKLYARGQVINRKLEKMGDEILSAHGFGEKGGRNGGNS